ncbi:MAG: hypothetical protein WCK77_13550 [Verrucomicrobiota bacterium]
MRNTVEFSTPEEIRKIRESTPPSSTRKGSYNDSILRPEYAPRKLRFPPGKSMIRIVPSIKPSAFDWMIGVQTLNYKDGRHAHPRTLGSGKSAFDHAYSWFHAQKPEALFTNGNRAGYKLLADPVSMFWCLVEEDGKWVARLYVGSGYDGSRGGVPGLGCQIYKMVKDLTEEANPLADPVHPENGVMITVEKLHPAGSRYPSYSLRLGSNPAPISQLISRMADEEISALCPLENTIRILSMDEEFERLEKIGINPETISAIRSSVH